MLRWAAAALVCLSILPGRAAAFFVRPAFKQTTGSRNYESSYGSVDFGGDWHLKPSFNSYHSDDATGTYKTWGLAGVYDDDKFSYVVRAGFTPRVNGYASHYAGGSVTESFDFEEGEADRAAEAQAADMTKRASRRKLGLSRLDVTGSLTQTQHSDEFTQTVNAKGKPVIARSSTTLEMGQTDLEGDVVAELARTSLELDLTKSIYNKDIAKIGARAAQVTFLSGLNSVVQGFPDVNLTARWDLELWDVVQPWVSYTYTSYKVQQPFSAAYTLGLDGSFREWRFSASYERFAQAGGADRNYLTGELARRFE